jgi:hypothetical protein
VALPLLGGFAATLAGCGGAHVATTPLALTLQRQDLATVSRALRDSQGPAAREVAATRTAWPLVANGLPADTRALVRPVAAAAASAASVKLPPPFEEAPAASLTGPASGLAGLFRTYAGLTTRSWRQIGAAIAEIEHGPPAAARFARENSPLYIESVYDAHFALAQIGKQLTRAYAMLGGPTAFGKALTQAEVNALAASYSEGADRLHPHSGVRLGS